MTDTTDPNDPRWMAFVAWAQRRWGKEAWHHTINTCGEWDAWNGALEQQAHAAKVASDMAEIRERVIAHQKDIIRDQAAQIEALQLTKAGLIGSLREEMDEGLRLRELGGALPNENITAMTERLIGERAALAAELSARRADAERLDFLESKRLPAYTVWNVTRHWRTDGSNDMEERSTFEGWSVVNQSDPLPTIRDAIDAALRQEQPNE